MGKWQVDWTITGVQPSDIWGVTFSDNGRILLVVGGTTNFFFLTTTYQSLGYGGLWCGLNGCPYTWERPRYSPFGKMFYVLENNCTSSPTQHCLEYNWFNTPE